MLSVLEDWLGCDLRRFSVGKEILKWLINQHLRPCNTRYKSRTEIRYLTLVIQIPWDLNTACTCPHRQFHTLPSLLHCQVALPNSYPYTPACQAGRQVVAFLWWSLVRPGRDVNPRPTTWEADMLTTKLSRRSHNY